MVVVVMVEEDEKKKKNQFLQDLFIVSAVPKHN
jgi:hypothetical protein